MLGPFGYSPPLLVSLKLSSLSSCVCVCYKIISILKIYIYIYNVFQKEYFNINTQLKYIYFFTQNRIRPKLLIIKIMVSFHVMEK